MSGSTGSSHRVLGMLGTFVLDRIVGLPGRAGGTRALGGIAYSLAAAVTALPEGWSIRTIARVGRDAEPVVGPWLRAHGLDDTGIVWVDRPNNRVELRYEDDARRTEHLTGGVGAWSWRALQPRVAGCDALYLNFISGHELDLGTARALREEVDVPMYGDFHSLLLGTRGDGVRTPRTLPESRAWLACFDAVQVNVDELDLLRDGLDPDEFARAALSSGPQLLTCTLGADGARTWSSQGVEAVFAEARRSLRGDGAVVRREIPTRPVAGADPTGCGDVWGAVAFCRLLAGDDVHAAASAANRAAAAAARTSGADELAVTLRRALAGHDTRGGEP